MNQAYAMVLAEVRGQIADLQSFEALLLRHGGGEPETLTTLPLEEATPVRAQAARSPRVKRGKVDIKPVGPLQQPLQRTVREQPLPLRGKLKVVDMVRLMANKLGGFSAESLREHLLERWPDQKTKIENGQVGACARLVELGELTMQKEGRRGFYRKTAKLGAGLTPTQQGEALLDQIHQEEKGKLGS